MKTASLLLQIGVLIILAAFISTGCAPTTSGQVRNDTTVTGTSAELKTESDVSNYKGPKLRVGVVNFQNKTPSRVLGIGEAAARHTRHYSAEDGSFYHNPSSRIWSRF